MSNDNYHIRCSFVFRFLKRFCPEHLYEEIEGDLLQCFHRDIKTFGERKAKRRLIWNVIRFFRPGIILRNKFSRTSNSFDMVSHFFRIFLRTSIKHPGYYFINVCGLAVGLAACFLVVLWVMDEISYDDIHHNKHNIFQVMGHHAFPDGTETYDNTPGPLAGALKNLPEVEESARLTFIGGKVLFQYADKSLYEEGAYADASIFNIFTLSLMAGDETDPMPHKNAIAISRKLADKYFNNEEAIGKVFRLNANLDAIVTAVFEDLPENSSLKFEFLRPYELYSDGDIYNTEWGAWTGGRTFVKLYDATSRETANIKIAETITKPNIWPRWDSNVEMFLFPMTDWRLRGNFVDGRQQGGRITYIKIFALVAGLILLIACVNFMNLATARSMIRAREIGIRKVVGAARRSITGQFMLESVLNAGIALSVALILVHILLPAFNDLTSKRIVPDYTNPILYAVVLTVTLLAGVMAGSYPSLFLSSLKVIQVLKGKLTGNGGAGARKALVVFQFSTSIVLIIFALVVYQQIEYMRNKDLGFDKENIVIISTTPALKKHHKAFAVELNQHRVVQRVSRCDNNPMDNFFRMVLADDAWPGKRKEDNIVFKVMRCDAEFLPSLGFEIVEEETSLGKIFPILSTTSSMKKLLAG